MTRSVVYDQKTKRTIYVVTRSMIRVLRITESQQAQKYLTSTHEIHVLNMSHIQYFTC